MEVAQAINELQHLPPLPKLHLSWPYYGDDGPTKYVMWRTENRELLRQLTRICGSIPIQAEASAASSHIAVVQQEFSDTPVCLTFRPYREMGTKQLPASQLGAQWRKDVDDLMAQCERFAAISDQVKHVGFDLEFWSTKRDDLDAMRMHFTLCYRMAKQAFPPAKVFFYAHGAMRPISSDAVYEPSPYVPLNAPGDYFTCAAYGSSLIGRQTVFAKSLAYAGTTKPWLVYLALGYAGRLPWKGPTIYGGPGLGVDDAWRMGLELNHPWAADPVRRHRFPMSAAEVVRLYPSATIEKFPDFLPEFIAYVKGAHNLPLEEPDTSRQLEHSSSLQ